MNRVVLDAEMRAKLNDGRTPAEFTDENGNVIGHFLTNEAFERIVGILFPPVTDREVAEAREEMLRVGGVPGDEFLARLQAITGELDNRS